MAENRVYADNAIGSDAVLKEGHYLFLGEFDYTFGSEEGADVIRSLNCLELGFIEHQHPLEVFEVVTPGMFFGLTIELDRGTCYNHLHREKK